MLRDLILRNRSYRRFYEAEHIPAETLRGLVDLARLSASSANLQPLRYALSNGNGRNAAIFPMLRWAGYLKDWDGPAPGERPAAYIIILNDTTVSKTVNCDHGIAAQSILLGATELGLGGCVVASIDKPGLKDALSMPVRYDMLLVIALGRPREEVVLETVPPSGGVKYWRDASGVHHVPKRRLEDCIIIEADGE